ncbi:MAG TPA: hypothetical protein DEH02_12670 [Bacteroidales bacterium]|nr:hypothetical protein [Bacteroidales bacterium]
MENTATNTGLFVEVRLNLKDNKTGIKVKKKKLMISGLFITRKYLN